MQVKGIKIVSTNKVAYFYFVWTSLALKPYHFCFWTRNWNTVFFCGIVDISVCALKCAVHTLSFQEFSVPVSSVAQFDRWYKDVQKQFLYENHVSGRFAINVLDFCLSRPKPYLTFWEHNVLSTALKRFVLLVLFRLLLLVFKVSEFPYLLTCPAKQAAKRNLWNSWLQTFISRSL